MSKYQQAFDDFIILVNSGKDLSIDYTLTASEVIHALEDTDPDEAFIA